MTNFIEELDNRISMDKEVLSVMPKNNKKNKKIYLEKINEIKEEYLRQQKNNIAEIKRRIKKIELISQDPEIIMLENKLKRMGDINILNPFNTSYEKMQLDENLFVLRRFYKNNLGEVNNNIEQCIKKFQKVGVDISPSDFIYSAISNEYMVVFFEEMRKGNVNSQRIKDVFEDLYWKCSDIIIHIELNMRQIYFLKEKIIDKYFVAKKEELLSFLKLSDSEALYGYLNIKRELFETKNKDTRVILQKFLNGDLDVKDYEKKQIDSQYAKILVDDIAEYTPKEFEEVNQNIIKLSNSLFEYQNYLSFQFILKKLQEIYKEKEVNKKAYEIQLKKIAKEEKKLIVANAKFKRAKKRKEIKWFRKKSVELLEKINLDVNKKILEIRDMYRELSHVKVSSKIYSCLNDFSTIYDALYLMSSFYGFLVQVIIESFPDISGEEIIEKVNELREFLKFPYITIINNITIENEKDVVTFIKDKYNLYNLNITRDDLEETVLENLIKRINILVNSYYLTNSKLDLEDIKYLIRAQKLLDK